VNSILNTVQLLLVDTLIAMRMNLLLENNPCPAMIKAVKKSVLRSYISALVVTNGIAVPYALKPKKTAR